MADLTSILGPYAYPAPWKVLWADRSSRWLPGLAAVLAIGAGVASLPGQAPSLAAWFGVAGGVLGAAATWATNYSSRVRDAELRRVQALTDMNRELADRINTRITPSF